MNSQICGDSPRTKWLTLGTVCGMALALTTTAHAQNFRPPASLGMVIMAPLSDVAWIVRENTIRQSNVTMIHLSQAAFGNRNTQIATLSIRQDNGAPARMVWLPKRSLETIRQLNSDSTFIEQAVSGSMNAQIAQVEVMQSNQSVSPGTRFMLTPLAAVRSIRALNQMNFNVVHITQVAMGSHNTQVALVAVDHRNSSKLKVPRQALNMILQLNVNVVVVNQFAFGSGNMQVADVQVNQLNGA